MTWYAWVIVVYFVIDRIGTIGMIGRNFPITKSIAITNLITGALIIWAIVALAAT